MDINNNQIFENREFKDITGQTELTSKSFYECTFLNCDFSGTDLSGSLLSDCKFKNCNFSLVVLIESKLQEVSFEDCKIMGADFTQISKLMINMGFRNSQINDCNFSSLDLQNTKYINCRITQSDFFETNLREADFTGSDLENSIFEQTDLRDADFKLAKNYRINPMINKIKGAEFSMPEAVRLLDSFEIKISEE